MVKTTDVKPADALDKLFELGWINKFQKDYLKDKDYAQVLLQALVYVVRPPRGDTARANADVGLAKLGSIFGFGAYKAEAKPDDKTPASLKLDSQILDPKSKP